MSRFRRFLAPAVALTLVAAVAPVARAQAVAGDSLARIAPPSLAPASVAAPAAGGSTVVQAAPVAVMRATSGDAAADEAFRAARTREAGAVAMRQASRGSGKMYMIIGGVTFLAGAIIGDDAGTIIMIGGAAVGIYGLYLYLQ
jgi:hypothetical protein